jgi:hypothetical protein
MQRIFCVFFSNKFSSGALPADLTGEHHVHILLYNTLANVHTNHHSHPWKLGEGHSSLELTLYGIKSGLAPSQNRSDSFLVLAGLVVLF